MGMHALAMKKPRNRGDNSGLQHDLKKLQLSIKFTGPARPVAEKHSSKTDFILTFSTILRRLDFAQF